MIRRTFAEVEISAVRADRHAARAHAERYCAGIDALTEKGRVTAAEATLLKRRIRAFADDLVAGLHAGDGR
ncbi:MAG: hypothetical protein AB7O91_04005 [Sphingomonas sp.]